MRLTSKFLAVFLLAMSQAALSGQPTLESGSVLSAAERLKAGEFLWAPDIAPEGPVLLVVSLATQRAVIYRNGVPIGITTVSSGRPGYRTPTGVFTILQRGRIHVEDRFREAVEGVLRPGTTVLVTPDSLRAGSTGQSMTVVEG